MNYPFFVKLLIAIFGVIASMLVVLSPYHHLEMLGLLALIYGLRHGLDADHILAIDNVTRQFRSKKSV